MSGALEPRLIGELLALFVHDLRNPLSALSSNVRFVEHSGATRDADVAEALRDSSAACAGIAHFAENLNLFARVLAQGRGRTATRLCIDTVVAAAVRRMGVIASSHRVELSLEEPAGEREGHAFAESELFALMVTNLIRNGIEHAPAETTVVVAIRRDEQEGTVSVTDAGPPLDGELLERAFTAEGQLVSKGLAAGRYGRGLGLYAARLAADAVGARLRAETTPDGRSRLALAVPLVA